MTTEKKLLASENSTYAQCYGIKQSYIGEEFTPRSQLIKKHWIENSEGGGYTKLQGYWHDSDFTSTQENYFNATGINGEPVPAQGLNEKLLSLSKSTLNNHNLAEFSDNISMFAADSSFGWEYPILNSTEANEISDNPNAFNYLKVLRYAFASSYAYSLDNKEGFTFKEDALYQELMLTNGELDIVAEHINVKKIFAVAIKVPANESLGLVEEVIIAFKGTDNLNDTYEDIRLALANLAETDADWQQTAYDFCQSVLQKFPVNRESIASGYQHEKQGKQYNVVLTGHSLGGYTATDSGVRTGIQTRVFSAPGTKIVESIPKFFANTMWLRNVINFRRDFDPVSSAGLRHDENEVEFPAASKLNLIENHFLTPFINDVLEPLAAAQRDNAKLPTDQLPRQLFVMPNTIIGAGLNLRINCWGKVAQTNDVSVCVE